MLATACIALEFAKLVRVNKEIRTECDRILASKCSVAGSQSEFSQSARRAMLNEMTAADFAGQIRRLDPGEESVSSVRTIRSDEPMDSGVKKSPHAPRHEASSHNTRSSRSLPVNTRSLAGGKHEEWAKSFRLPSTGPEPLFEISSPVRVDLNRIDETDAPAKLPSILLDPPPSQPAAMPEPITNGTIATFWLI